MDSEKIKRIFYSNNEPYYTMLLSHENQGALVKYGSTFMGQKGAGILGDFSKHVIPVRIRTTSDTIIESDEHELKTSKRPKASPLKSDNRKMLAGAGSKKRKILPPIFEESL